MILQIKSKVRLNAYSIYCTFTMMQRKERKKNPQKQMGQIKKIKMIKSRLTLGRPSEAPPTHPRTLMLP